MDQLLCKALHIVGFVSWFSGLFYLVRLFIYHVEAQQKPEPARSILVPQLALMERRLWFAITLPAMILTLVAGGFLAGMYIQAAGGIGEQPWLHVKLALVAALVAYTLLCGRIRKQLAAGAGSRW